MTRNDFIQWISSIQFGKRLPDALYIARLSDWEKIPSELAATIQRAMMAAKPDPAWNLLKLHTDQVAISFLTYLDFDSDPHPKLLEAVKINMNTGSMTKTDYRKRANPPILHRKETFLPPSDPRISSFAELTAEEESAGLYRDCSRIGLFLHWQLLLTRKGLRYEGHHLCKITDDPKAAYPDSAGPSIERHRTAIKRYDLSKPTKLALDRGIISKGRSFFDYGCGHGTDIDALKSLGFEAAGWDPAFRPIEPKREADIVNLGYVLNVIEDSAERLDTLRSAFALAKYALVVSTMVTGQETASHTRPFRDGFLTKTNTFQKFYAPGELEALIEETLQVETITLSLGICVAFKNPKDVEEYVSSRNRRRIDWTEISAQLTFTSGNSLERRRVDRYELHRDLFDAFWRCIFDLGRLPELAEFPQLGEVRSAAGGLNRAVNVVVKKNGEELWKRARQAAEEDVLVYLAMTNFRRKLLRREIPPRIKNDIKAFFGDLDNAKAKAKEILFSAGDPGELEIAVESLDFGAFDREQMQFTFHRSLLDRLPPVLRVYVHCGAIRYGAPNEADLIKIHISSGKLSFFHYDDYENNKHPVLRTRIKINLRTRFVQVFDHSAENQGLQDKAPFL